jgi:uncharacterized protein (DUF1919 family)
MLAQILSTRRKRLLGQGNFSIISNNCWGAHAYKNLSLEYTTPFIGVYLLPSDYVNLLTNFQSTIWNPLKFRKFSEHIAINSIRSKSGFAWPIGYLDNGVEIQFLHYRTEQEALDKWNRRRERLASSERIYFKFCDRDSCSVQHLKSFLDLPHKNKVFFTTKLSATHPNIVRLPLGTDVVPDGLTLSKISPRYFDGVDWLLGGSGRVKFPSRFFNKI